MAKILTDSQHYKNIANSIRAKIGSTVEYYPAEMSGVIDDIIIPDTLVAANGDVAAIRRTDIEHTPLTATANDIRIGTTAITEDGKIIGTKEIPAYHTTEGAKLIPAGSEIKIKLAQMDKYDYTKLQAMICDYNSGLSNSVLTRKVVINDCMYTVNSTDKISDVVKDDTTKTIMFGITNSGDAPCVLRYFTYKEIE